MSFADEEEFNSFLHQDHALPHITSDAVAKKLSEEGLTIASSCNEVWLATAVRRVLAITIPGSYDSHERTGNRDIKAQLNEFAANLDSVWLKLHECDWEAERRIWEHSWNLWEGDGGTEVGEGMVMGEPTLHKRFKKTVREIDWLAGYLRLVAKETEVQKGPWRQSEKAKNNLERALVLAPVYELAFETSATGNNFPSGTHRHPTGFMSFYQAMVHLAFDEPTTPNWSGVIKEACKIHKKSPTTFSEGLLPKLSGE